MGGQRLPKVSGSAGLMTGSNVKDRMKGQHTLGEVEWAPLSAVVTTGLPRGSPKSSAELVLQSIGLSVTFLCFQFCGKNCKLYQQSPTASKQHRNNEEFASLTCPLTACLVPKGNTVPVPWTQTHIVQVYLLSLKLQSTLPHSPG